jgi:hypothetical protein
MFTRNFARLIVVLAPVLFVAALLAFAPTQASAAQPAGDSENSCLTCHEDLYYLHDSGCAYCLTPAHKDRCVDCHEGDATTMNVELSHLGMLPHPQENGGAKCLECHEQDELAGVLNTFDANGGFDVVIKAESHAPDYQVEASFPEVEEVSPFAASWKWLAGAFVAFGLWLVLVFFSPLKP